MRKSHLISPFPVALGLSEEGRKNYDRTFGPKCDRCGEPLEEEHCKLVCKQCDFNRDCGDP